MSDGDLFSPALTNFSPASLPRQLWFWYIEYLCRPAPGSWVSSVASTLRILAVVLIAPFVLLTLLVSPPAPSPTARARSARASPPASVRRCLSAYLSMPT